ncbi:programmed cell death protein 2-like isoform X2 [Glandiceps talaboti]
MATPREFTATRSPSMRHIAQLPRSNKYYGYEPPEEKESSGQIWPTDFDEPMCVMCGSKGPKRCGKCHKVAYCGRDHQKIDWKSGHKKVCCKEGSKSSNSMLLFPEYEVVTESEDYKPAQTEKSEEEKMKEYSKFVETEKGETMMKNKDMTEGELDKMAAQEEDVQFQIFRERIRHEPEQILRYQRGGEPLWVSSQHIPKDDDIQVCKCGAPRIFEFQILPQLLNHLKVDSLAASIDWGTLAIYTCSASCDLDPVYHQEFVWKQDYTDQSITK